MQSISYLISLGCSIILFFLLPIKKEKSNFLLRATLLILISFTIPIFCSLIFYFAKLNISLWIYTIINIVASLFMIRKIAKERRIQKYEINLTDIIFIGLVTLIIVAIAIKNYGIPFSIKYQTTDASSHYVAAMHFMKEKKILLDSSSDIGNYVGFYSLMIGAYVNEGIFFSIFENILEEFYFYKLYICYDLFMLFCSALVMYEAIIQLVSNTTKKRKYIAVFISIIYFLGYPLNSILMGSAYLTLSIILISGILLLLQLKDKMSEFQFCILLFLINLGIMHTYVLFAIFVFIAEIFYFILNEKKKLLFFSKTLIGIILPFLSGAIYLVYKGIENIGIIGIIGVNGPIYTNLYSNILPYIPIVLYALYQNLKNKENYLENWIIGILVIIFPALFYLKQKEMVSNYYVMKFYYLLWIIVMLLTARGMFILFEKHLKVGVVVTTIVPTLLILSFLFTEGIYSKEETYKDASKEKFWTVSEMLKINFNIINSKIYTLDKEEIDDIHDLFKYVESDKKELEVVGVRGKINWVYAMYDFANTEINNGEAESKLHNMENIKSKYLLTFEKTSVMYECLEKILEKYNYIYKTENIGILVRKSEK